MAERALAVQPAARVGERGEHDGQRPDHAPSAAAADRTPGEHADADEAEHDARRAAGRPERSPGLNLIASSATKIGTDAFAIAATPESMCFSPQAISVNGIAPLIDPEDDARSRQARPHLAERLADPSRAIEEREQQQSADQEPQRDEHASARSRGRRP